MNTWKDLSLFVVSETHPSCFNRVIEHRCKGRRLQSTWETATSLVQFGQYRPEVKCRTKLHFRVRGSRLNHGMRQVSASTTAGIGRKLQRSSQWYIRLAFVLYDVYFHDCDSHDSFTIPVFPLWGKVHGRLSAITNANRLHCRNSEKLKKH